MASDYLDLPPRSFSEVVRDKMLATLDAHAADEFVRVVWAPDGLWAMMRVGEMIAALRADTVADPDRIERLEFLIDLH